MASGKKLRPCEAEMVFVVSTRVANGKWLELVLRVKHAGPVNFEVSADKHKSSTPEVSRATVECNTTHHSPTRTQIRAPRTPSMQHDTVQHDAKSGQVPLVPTHSLQRSATQHQPDAKNGHALLQHTFDAAPTRNNPTRTRTRTRTVGPALQAVDAQAGVVLCDLAGLDAGDGADGRQARVLGQRNGQRLERVAERPDRILLYPCGRQT